MRASPPLPLLVAACAAIAMLPAAGIADATLPEQAADCGRMAADADRLACYDALFRRQEAAAAAPVAQEQAFGLSEAERQQRERAAGAPPTPDQLTSTVVRVTVRKPHPELLELENGQSWRLLETSRSRIFRVNDRIVIRQGALGSYLASIEGRNGSWRIRRVD